MKLGTAREGFLLLGNFALVVAQVMLVTASAMAAVGIGTQFLSVGVTGRAIFAVAGGILGWLVGQLVCEWLRGSYLQPTPPRRGRAIGFDVISRR